MSAFLDRREKTCGKTLKNSCHGSCWMQWLHLAAILLATASSSALSTQGLRGFYSTLSESQIKVDCLMQRYLYFKGMKTEMKSEMKIYSLDGFTRVCHIKPALNFPSLSFTEGRCFTYLASGSGVGSTLWIIFLLLLEAALLAAH